jgi:DNA polymerase-3 subunit alpha
MKRYLRELKPTVFDDLIAMGALYRPGPMQFIDNFIDRKHGRAEITYFHPTMENALKMTYGVLVYQEQVMQIAKEMSGFTGGQADTLRKGVAKKKPEVLAKMKKDFIEGAITHSNADRDKMEEFWTQLEAFAAYCFPKAHAACYALISYETAYLKAHYPAAFMSALLTSDYGSTDRIAIEVAECQRMGVKVLPPDVNESFLEFAVVQSTHNIRFGLSAVKNVGTGPIEAILRAREAGGPFMSIEDFAKRVDARECNKKVWDSLGKTGAFDGLIGGDRGLLLYNIDLITAYASKAQKNALSGQIDIFGSLGVEESAPALRLDPPPVPVTNREQLAWERDLLGLYLSHHPLDDYETYLADTTNPIGAITPEADGKLIRVGGLITTVRKILTKKGDTMAFVGLEDKTGITELIVFPKAYQQSPQVFETDNIIMTSGKIAARDREGRLTGEPKIMIDSAKVIDYETARTHKPLHVRPTPQGSPNKPSGATEPQPIASSAPPVTHSDGFLLLKLTNLSDQQLLHEIKEILGSHDGPAETFIIVGDNSPKKIRLPFKVTVSDDLIQLLSAVVGEGQVSRSL